MYPEAHLRNNLNLLEGCHGPEMEPDGPYVWAPSQFELRLPRQAIGVHLQVDFHADEGTMELFDGETRIERAPLRRGRQDCLLTMPENRDRLRLRVSPAEKEGDGRELAVMIRKVSLLDDPEDMKRLRFAAENALLNDAEYRLGIAKVESYPPYLRITSEMRCNIPETSQACSYCAWDHAKSREQGAPAFSLNTLNELGGFYSGAHSIGDCSIGEPMMNRDFGAVVSRFDKDEKHFSFTTNGQLLVEQRRRQVLGRNLYLYVSLDSATAEGYKRYRNDRFDKIIDNLRLLCSEKRAHGNLPWVIASFIVMRSNVHELEPYIRLMKDVGIDMIKLRALYEDDYTTDVVVNNGYRFDYWAEILSRNELLAAGEKARRWADEVGMTLYVEWDQFEPLDDRSAGQPICAEPWKTFYALARGIQPCCYGTTPMATWQEQGDRPLDQFLRDVFNSEEYQTLRSELAAGRLPPYCQAASSCPIVKRQAG
jgi:MoaA/NifB/PqqE/SkfB family radical SAM enzyme